MSIFNSIIVVIIWHLLSLLFIRADISGIIAYRLNKNARKKRKKGQTFKEWFLYSRYRNEIPKIFLVLYFFINFIHPLALLLCISFHFIKELTKFEPIVFKIVLFGIPLFGGSWILILQILFWTRIPGPYVPYERWISKKGGKKKRK